MFLELFVCFCFVEWFSSILRAVLLHFLYTWIRLLIILKGSNLIDEGVMLLPRLYWTWYNPTYQRRAGRLVALRCGLQVRCPGVLQKKHATFNSNFFLRYTRDTYDVLMHNCQSLRKSQHQGKHFSPRHALPLDSHQGNHFSDEVAAFLIEVKAMVGIGCLWHKSDFQTLMTWPWGWNLYTNDCECLWFVVSKWGQPHGPPQNLQEITDSHTKPPWICLMSRTATSRMKLGDSQRPMGRHCWFSPEPYPLEV